MIVRSPRRQCRQQRLIHPHSDHLTRTVTNRRTTSPAEPLHRVTTLCLISPRLDLFLGDRLATDRLSRHEANCITKPDLSEEAAGLAPDPDPDDRRRGAVISDAN